MKRLLVKLAAYVAGAAGGVLRGVPGLVGALMVCYGLSAAWRPLGFIAAGGFLLLIDRRVP